MDDTTGRIGNRRREDDPDSPEGPLQPWETSKRGEYYKVWKARKRQNARSRTPHPWHYFHLPKLNPLESTSAYGWRSDTSDSEDEVPRRHHLLGEYRLIPFTEDISQKEQDKRAPLLAVQDIPADQFTPPIITHTCKYCSKITIDLRRYPNDMFLRREKRYAASRKTRKSGFTVADVIQAANDGCVLFAKLVSNKDGPYSDEERINLFKKQSRHVMMNEVLVSDASGLEVHFSDETYNPSAARVFEIFTLPGTKPLHPMMGTNLPPNLIPSSQLSFGRVRSWIKNCDKNHTACKEFKQTFIPKRLLELTEHDGRLHLRLCCNPDSDEYATLSYRWGGDQPAETTKERIASYEKDISLDLVPRTILDAAIVTLGLGLRYLWVDAMCIIQDDGVDMLDQIAQMHRIYRASTITIAAANSYSSRDGFLHPREWWWPTKVSARFDENVFGDVILVPWTQEGSMNQDLALYERAWTFQELHLSTRVIAYGNREMMFRCLQETRTDGGHGKQEIDHGSARAVDPGSQIFGDLPHPFSWGAFVGAYSERDLTKEYDKLLGIAALAEEYSRTKQVTLYYAGLWKEALWRQCLWTPWTSSRNPKPSRPEVYRAPSWSWASINGGVKDVDNNDWVGAVEHQAEGTRIYTQNCVIIDVQTTLCKPEHRFGAVKFGFLQLKTRMKCVIFLGDNKGKLDYAKGRGMSDAGSAQRKNLDFDIRLRLLLDIKEEWANRIDDVMWCADICTVEGGLNQGHGLLLEEVRGIDGCYQRIGRMDLLPGFTHESRQNWFDQGFEWQEITII